MLRNVSNTIRHTLPSAGNEKYTKHLNRGAWSGFLRPITDQRKQYLPIRSLMPIILKPSFYHVELFILMIQSRFFEMYSGPEYNFWKWIPFLGDSCERIFNFEVWRSACFKTFFKNLYLSHLNVWSRTAFLFWQSFNCHTIAYTQADFMSCMWDGPFTPGSHILCLQCVCSPCAVHKPCRSSTDYTVKKNPTFERFY